MRRGARPSAPAPEPGGIVCIANMHHPVKGQTDLLLAMKEVLRERPEAHLVFVGDGVRRPHLERLGAPARDRGALPLPRPPARRPAILARAAISVSASYAEGISNAILEAMAARLPVVATAVGGSPELVRDGVNGYLVPPGAPAPLARRLVDAAREPAAAQADGRAGPARSSSASSASSRCARSYDALYEDLTGLKVPRVMYGAA